MQTRHVRIALPGRIRLRIWLRRYLPAEAAGTAASLSAAGVAAATGGGAGSAVVAAAWAESAGFYSFVILRELRRAGGGRWRPRTLAEALRAVVAEFGVAEVVDTVLVRPVLMYAFVVSLGGLVPGVIVGKLAADVVFYALAASAYELRARARA